MAERAFSFNKRAECSAVILLDLTLELLRLKAAGYLLHDMTLHGSAAQLACPAQVMAGQGRAAVETMLLRH